MKKNIITIALAITFLVLCGCAQPQPQIKNCLVGHEYGFWGGLWHGMIAPIAFIASLFNDEIDVFAINNNGGWYLFGFMLGIGSLLGGGASTRK